MTKRSIVISNQRYLTKMTSTKDTKRGNEEEWWGYR